jgi:ubiquinone/menaquinone biosynthesis C-methylase UbiE
MTQATFDATAYKQGQQQTWNALADAWAKWFDAFEDAARPVTRKLLELAAVAPGHSVLDIGTGTGEPALSAAAAVGARGRVVAVDQAGAMLAVARRKAASLGHITFIERDVENLDLEERFDAVLSRWGLMFLPHRDQVLRKLFGLLKEGGILAASVWDVPPKVPMIALAFGVIGSKLSLPPPPAGAPSPFGMADVDRVAGELRAAGFSDTSFEHVPVEFKVPSAAAAVDFLRDLLPPPMRAVLRDRCGSENAPEIWDAVGEAVRKFERDDKSICMTSSSICFKAVK